MTIFSIEQEHRVRYAKAREALWGKPRLVNAAVENKRAIEAYRADQLKKWEEARGPKAMLKGFLRRGTSNEFVIENTVSYWFGGAMEPGRIIALRDMEAIAREVLADHPGITLDHIRSTWKSTECVDARRAVAVAIKSRCPEMSLTSIGKFLDRDHATVSVLLRRYDRKAKRLAGGAI